METASFHGSKQDLELVTHSSVFKKEMNYERMRGLCFDRFLFHGMLLDTPNAIERRQSTHGPFSLRTAARKHKCTIYQPQRHPPSSRGSSRECGETPLARRRVGKDRIGG